ncbi:hypothetical protein FE257_006998 [Aspergillus nanangensis]|uniref:Carrier domain-containing protein n=1 Tax=Aspergillus nanangensis TaxID=2582783 RepID=A0AAD4GUF8_ASPNN|nr:hypothetical protein FE257_006998 [Aspergillus nanangensis]
METYSLDSSPRNSSSKWSTIEMDDYAEYQQSKCQDPLHHSVEHDAPPPPPPIAIVGMGVRLPGGVRSPSDFWQLMIDKKCASAPVPLGRYNAGAFHGTPGVDTQSVVARNGYFLDDDYLGKADSSFFRHNKYEHAAQDPQQMLLLEVVWECMENGGQVDWKGTEIGCFVGTFGEDWLDLTAKDTQKLDPLHVVGTGDYAVSNRVSYEYDLKGPCMTCRTACSSSLVALHEACQAIALGDCPSAIVGGTSLIFTPTMTANMSQAGALSPEGKCKTFDASADGYARAEGICALYIKKLDDAIRDGDPVRGVIRAVATNFDGKTNHISVPSVEGQETLIRKAYRKAHIENLAETAFVECHGTATPVGDVIETTAVANAFGKQGMIIGGVKPNIGHTEGAAGLAGIIKAVLALEHKQIPPNVNFSTPNPAILFAEAKLQVPIDTLPWPKDRKERVSINCFGVGGTNAHVIVDSAASVMQSMQPSSPAEPKTVNTDIPRLVVVSASHTESLDRRITETQEYLSQHPDSLDDLAYTLAAKREHLRQRAFAVVDPTIPAETNAFIKNAVGHKSNDPSVTFVFPGQGVQWRGMGTHLLKSFPSFRMDMERMDHVLQGLPNGPSWKIVDEIAESGPISSNIDKPEFSQPLCTAIQIGLVNLLRSWGIVPSKVIGHSSGEFAAAYAANAISSETAIILAYTRGVVAEMASETGGMLAVSLGRDEAAQYLREGIVVACENSPQSVTLAGDRSQLEQVAAEIREDNSDVLVKLLPVQRAYHSPHMALVGETYENLIQPHLLRRNDAMIDMYSTVLGTTINNPNQLDATYWRRSLESPVLFATAFQELSKAIERKHELVVEIASHSALRGSIRQILQQNTNVSYTYCETLNRGDPSVSRLFAVAGTAYMLRWPVDLVAVNNNHQGNIVTTLPPYPWRREDTSWKESRISKMWRLRPFPRHELLGSRCLESSDIEPAWRNILKAEEVPWINEHRIQGLAILPGVAYAAIASEAIRQITGSTDCTVRRLLLLEALVRESDDIELMTTLRKMALNATMDSTWYEFTVSSYSGQAWTKHCTGQVREGRDRPLRSSEISPPFGRAISSWKWYRRCEKKGLGYGPRFEGLRDISAHPLRNMARGRVHDDPSLHGSYYAIHPTVVDQCLQVALVAGDKGVSHYPDKAGMPVYIDRFYMAHGVGSMLVEADTSDPREGNLTGSFRAVSESTGDVVLDISGLRLLPIPDMSSETRLATSVRWKPDIRFLPAAQQTPCPVDPGSDLMVELSQALFLIVLTFMPALESQSSPLPYLARYREMIMTTGRNIVQGAYDHIPGVSEIRVMDAEERHEAFLALKTKMPPLVEGFYSKTWEYATCRSTGFMDGEAFQDTSLLEPIQGIVEWSLGFFDWKTFLAPLSHSNPSLRILEIGAGAGSSTAVVLDALTAQTGDRPFAKYTATDLDAALVGHIKERFGHVSGMEFARLDISEDPAEQGFEPAGYDLVVVCNVLYETPTLRHSLDHIRSLLVPGGRLMMYEPCSEIPYLDILMGILPRWWLGVGQDREDKPYITVDRWEQELAQVGFSGIDTHAYNTPPPLNWQVVMLSTNPEPESPRNPISLVCTPAVRFHSWARDVARQFSENQYEVHWCIVGQRFQLQDDAIALLDLEEQPYLDSISASAFEQLQNLMGSANRILWITHSSQIACPDPRFGLVVGFARTLRGERNIDFGTLEIDCFDDKASSIVVPVYQHFTKPMASRDYEFIFHEGSVHTGRAAVTPVADYLADTDEHHIYELDIQTPGDLTTVGWRPVKEEGVGPDEIEVKAEYLSLNFKDLMMALGVVERTKTMDFSFETCGIVTKVGSSVTTPQVGDRVILFSPKPLRTYATVPAKEGTIVPADFSSVDAAAFPVAYTTAFCTLVDVGGLRKDQSVLIHSACGAVGLAALNICKHFGAEIFASVGSEEKVQYLMENYGLPRSRIFDSHSDAFLSGVMQETHGRGVDLVLNSLAGDLLRASWQCVATRGKLLEIGKRDILGHGALDLHGFQACRSFCSFDLYTVAFEDPSWGKRALEACVNFRTESSVKLPCTVFKSSEVESALRHMQTGQHIGKLVLKAPEEGEALPLLPAPRRFDFSPDAAYLVVGGLRGIGPSIVRWMVEYGARHFVFLSRTAGQVEEDQCLNRELESMGCHVVMVSGSVIDAPAVERAISQSSRPIAGVIQLSAVLRDRTFDKMTHEDWTTCLAAKVRGTWNLHGMLLNHPLDFFIMFSSAASFIGNPGQANYTAANSFLDSFVQYRRGLGLPASVVSLGPVDEMGLMAGKADLLMKARQTFHHVMGEADVLKAFQVALLSAKDGVVVSSSRPAVMATGLSSHIIASGTWLQQDAKFAALSRSRTAGMGGAGEATELKMLQQLASIQSDPSVLLDGTCESWIIEFLGEQLAARHGHNDEMDQAEYAGLEVDSLASLHIKHWLRRRVEVDVSITQIATAKTLGGVAALTVALLRDKYGVSLNEGA